MVVSRRVARFNRVATNRVVRLFAGRVPGFGLVGHRGRRSGHAYRTPVNVFPAGEGYAIALIYGAGSDWVRNVTAAGGCDLTVRGRRVDLVAPRVVHDESRASVPAPVRPVLRMLGVSDFLLLTRPSRRDGAAGG